MKPRHMCGVVDCAASDSVEHQRVDAALIDVDRVVNIPSANVRIEVPITTRLNLPVFRCVRIAARVHPIALLQAKHAEPRTCQSPGHGRARRARADDQYVSAFVFHHANRGFNPRRSSTYEGILPLRVASAARVVNIMHSMPSRAAASCNINI